MPVEWRREHDNPNTGTQTQMPTVTIELSDKYRRVVFGELPDGVNFSDLTEDEFNDLPYADAAESFTQMTDGADIEPDDPDNFPTLSWSHISPPNDSDLLDVMATYFDGIEQSDPAALIRAKLRLCDVDHVANAQIGAQGELNDEYGL